MNFSNNDFFRKIVLCILNVDDIFSEFHDNFQKMENVSEIFRNVVNILRKIIEISEAEFVIQFIHPFVSFVSTQELPSSCSAQRRPAGPHFEEEAQYSQRSEHSSPETPQRSPALASQLFEGVLRFSMFLDNDDGTGNGR